MINLDSWSITLPTSETIYPIEFNEYVKTDGDSLTFVTPCIGQPTQNSDYPRCELREIFNSKKAKWASGIGKHSFKAVLSVDRLPKTKPVVSVFQIHDGKNDVLQILVNKSEILYNYNGIKFKIVSYTMTEKFKIKCKVRNNIIFLRVNYEDEILLPINSDSLYFKTGNYLQSNLDIEKDSTQFSQVSIYELKVEHLFFK